MIDVSEQGEIAVVTLRHGKANAMDLEFCEAITACFEELKKSKAKAVVLTGEGKIFSAGVDLVRALEKSHLAVRDFGTGVAEPDTLSRNFCPCRRGNSRVIYFRLD